MGEVSLNEEAANLRAENERLRAELARHDRSFGKVLEAHDRWAMDARSRWKLSPQEARMLITLADGRAHGFDDVLEAVGAKTDNDRILDVLMCRLRKKITPFKIETIWGRGYRASADLVEELRRMLV